MSFTLTKYRGYTATDLKNRATIPDQSDMSVSGNDVIYNHITMTKIRDGIGEAVLKQILLSTSESVNPWSGFGPTRRREVNGVLVNDVVEPHGKCEFAGYNHDALTPCFTNTAHMNDILLFGAGNADFIADITIGEAKFIGGDIVNHGNCVGIALTVWDGANLMGFGITDLAGLKDYANLEASVYINTSKEYTCKIYLTNSLSAFNQNLDNVVCQLEELANWNTEVWVLAANSLNCDSGDWTVSAAGFDDNAGTCGFGDAYVNRDIQGMEIQAKLVRYDGYQIGTTQILFSGDYTSGTHLGSLSAYFGTNPLPSYGYTYQILFNEPY